MWQLCHSIQLQFHSISNSHSLIVPEKTARIHISSLCERVHFTYGIENGINTLCGDFHLVIKTRLLLSLYVPFDFFSLHKISVKMKIIEERYTHREREKEEKNICIIMTFVTYSTLQNQSIFHGKYLLHATQTKLKILQMKEKKLIFTLLFHTFTITKTAKYITLQ